MNKLPKLLRTFRDSVELQVIFHNFSWLLLGRFAMQAIAGLMSIWIARHLGPNDFGLLMYVFAVVMFAEPFISIGTGNLIVRDLVAQPDEQKRAGILASGLVINTAGAGLLFTALQIMAWFRQWEDTRTGPLLAAMSFMLLPKCLQIFDFWFESRIESRYTIISQLSATVLGSALRCILILTSMPLIYYAYTFNIQAILVAILLLAYFIHPRHSLGRWHIQWSYTYKILWEGFPLIISTAGVMIMLRIDQLMLKEFTNAYIVGQYSVAMLLVSCVQMIALSICSSIFPKMIQQHQTNPQAFNIWINSLYRYATWGMVAVSIFTSLFAPWGIRLLFGDEYQEAGRILQVLIWSSAPWTLSALQTRWLYVKNASFPIGMIAISSAGIDVLLNALLIHQYQGIGAAWATLLAHGCMALMMPFFWTIARPCGRDGWKTVFWPMLLLAKLLGNSDCRSHD